MDSPSTQPNQPNQLNQPNVLSLIGVKPAESEFHDFGRSLILIILILIVLWNIYNEYQETDDLKDLARLMKEDTIFYRELMDLEPKYRKRYLDMLKKNILMEKESIYAQYAKNILLAIGAGLCSEYIISGNIMKPFKGTARAALSAVVYSSFS